MSCDGCGYSVHDERIKNISLAYDSKQEISKPCVETALHVQITLSYAHVQSQSCLYMHMYEVTERYIYTTNTNNGTLAESKCHTKKWIHVRHVRLSENHDVFLRLTLNCDLAYSISLSALMLLSYVTSYRRPTLSSLEPTTTG